MDFELADSKMKIATVGLPRTLWAYSFLGFSHGGLSDGGGLNKYFSGSWSYSISNRSTNKLLFDTTNAGNRVCSKGRTIFR